MSVTDITTVATDLFSALEQRGGAAYLEQLSGSRRCSRDLAVMALGWLFKEGRVVIQLGIGDWFIAARTRCPADTAASAR